MIRLCSCGDKTTQEFWDAFGSCRKCAEYHYARLIKEQRIEMAKHQIIIDGIETLYFRISKYDLTELEATND